MMNSSCNRCDFATTTYRACVRVLIAASLALGAVAGATGPIGKGLFIEISDNAVHDDIDAVAATTPGTPSGVQLHVCWSAIQNDPNDPTVFDWDSLGDALGYMEANYPGMRAILRIDMVGGASRGSISNDGTDPALSTPPWIYSLPGIEFIGGDTISLPDPDDYPSGSDHPYIARVPWYGSEAYQDAVGDFAQELRDFLTGEGQYTAVPPEPTRVYSHLIECIRVGGWQANSNEPNFYHDYTDPSITETNSPTCYPCTAWKTAVKTELITDLQSLGVTFDFDGEPVLDDVSDYAIAQSAMLDAWISAFDGSDIPLSTTVNLRLRPCTADNDFLMHSLNAGMIILNPGLNEKDKSMTRAYYQSWHDPLGDYGVKVGWGGVTNIGSARADRVAAAFQGFGYDKDIVVPEELDSCIGDEAPFEYLVDDYTPIDNASYAIFGMNILDDGTDSAFKCTRQMIQYFAAP